MQRAGPRPRPRARPSSARRCGGSAPRRSSCVRPRRPAGERLAAVDVELARTDAERDEAQRRLEAAGAEPAEGEDRDELAEKLARYEKRREQLGQVNPLAKEEYDAEKERLEELSVQRADLEKSLDELEKLRDELTTTVETRFAETFTAVEQHFHEVAATLFPGGEGRLRLTEPEDEDEEPGIEVELRPAGKRVTRLSLLSGGEKALGAIAFLFSLFLARPSPFYLLDEVEAALDDTNIGRFTELLRTYADRAQFIVITHQKRTMEAADVLYGVTMGTDGVSQIVSRRLPRTTRSRQPRERPRLRGARRSCWLEGIDTWVFGGWGEELRGLIRPREHVDLDLLYPAEAGTRSTRCTSTGSTGSGIRGSARSCSRRRGRAVPRAARRARLVHAAEAPAAPLAGEPARHERATAGREHGGARELPPLVPRRRCRLTEQVSDTTAPANVPRSWRGAGESCWGTPTRARERRGQRGFFGRLRESLGKSRRALTEQLRSRRSIPPTTHRGSGSRRR